MREVIDRIVERLLAVDRRDKRHRRMAAEQERVAIGRGFRGAVRAGHAARAGDVLDAHLLAEQLAQSLRHDAPDRVDRPARRVWHDHGHRPRGPVLSQADRAGRNESQRRDQPAKHFRPQYRTTTSRSVPDSAPQASPGRPSIWRTEAPLLLLGKLSNFSVAGSNRRIALATKSVTQILSLSST